MRQDSITMVKLTGRTIYKSGGGYAGEELNAEAKRFFAAVRGGTVDAYMADHPELVNK
jgi:hypothetical protein